MSALLLLALLSCNSGGSDTPAAEQPSDAAIPASVQDAEGFYLVTTGYEPPTPGDFTGGYGAGGVIALGPHGCLINEQPGEPKRNRRLLMFPAESSLSVRAGEPFIMVGDLELTVGDGYDGGLSMAGPEEPIDDAFPELAAQLPEPCRRFPVAVVEEVNDVYVND